MNRFRPNAVERIGCGIQTVAASADTVTRIIESVVNRIEQICRTVAGNVIVVRLQVGPGDAIVLETEFVVTGCLHLLCSAEHFLDDTPILNGSARGMCRRVQLQLAQKTVAVGVDSIKVEGADCIDLSGSGGLRQLRIEFSHVSVSDSVVLVTKLVVAELFQLFTMLMQDRDELRIPAGVGRVGYGRIDFGTTDK